LVQGKKLIIISSRGGDYSGQMKAFDFQNPYLVSIFGFLGIKDIQVIASEGIYERDQAKRVEIAREKTKTQVQEIASSL
jgi:FMN-dependent NADH-azoreductase